ncbi:MAG: hypothetical protein IJ071_04330 [Ruminococcus sp.]|nr:hypothetical protein [Ruminococcus sp.]
MEDNRLEDFGPEKFDVEEKVFVDQTEFKDFDKPKHYRGKFFSVLTLVLSLVSCVYALGGFFWITAAVSGAALVVGAIALARKHSDAGVALSGMIIAGAVLAICIWTYADGSGHWEDEGWRMPWSFPKSSDYGDAEYEAEITEEVIL